MQIKKCVFVKSVARPDQLDLPPLPEIAMVGRSNVGKSSLINTLTNNSKMARVSSSPGKTRLVNFFKVNDRFYLVDLPGYGYAKVSKEEQLSWGAMIEGYLMNSKNLKHLFLLMDVRRTPNDADRQMAYWAQNYNIDCTIIATKADKVSRSQGNLAASKLSDELLMTFRTPTILFSSLKKTGVDKTLDRIEEILSADQE